MIVSDSHHDQELLLTFLSVHYYLHARNGDFAVQSPLVLGHESTGLVTAVGPGVHGISVGQRVAIEPGIMCKTCRYCIEGRYNLCKNMRFCSSAKTFPHTDGMLQERINHPASVLHPYVLDPDRGRVRLIFVRLPDGLPLSIACLAEPLSVLLHAAGRAGLCTPFNSPSPSKTTESLAQGKAVLVFGVGTIGILACALSKALGASKVCAVDIDPKRLEFATEGGWADSVYCLPRKEAPMPLKPLPNGVHVNGKIALPSQKPSQEDLLRKSKQTVEDALNYFKQAEGFDVVFECTGAESCIQMSVFVSLIFFMFRSDLSTVVCGSRIQNNAHWHGLHNCPSSCIFCSSQRSGYPRVFPLRRDMGTGVRPFTSKLAAHGTTR